MVQQSYTMQFIKNMFLLILYCIILTTNSNSEAKKFDDDFLRSLNSVSTGIKKWVFKRNSEEIIVPTIGERGILQLASPHDDDDPSTIELKEDLKEIFNGLECFHSLLTLYLFKMLRQDYQQKQINPFIRVTVTIWEFYQYLTRMNAVFAYGNFDVQEWQSNIYSRFKEMQNIDCLEDFVENIKSCETKDMQLMNTILEFGHQCQEKNYLPRNRNIYNVIRKSRSVVVYYNWLSCNMNIPCIRQLESRDGDLEVAATLKFFADRRPEEIKEAVLDEFQLNRNEMRSLNDPTEFGENKSDRIVRLPASKFGDVCKPTHNPDKILEQILFYEANITDAFRYEENHKKDAIEAFKNKSELEVTPCGGFVDEELTFLSARPDGLIKDDSILIVKCPNNVLDMTPQDALEHNQFKFLKVEKTGNIVLRTNAKYYYEVQGQLHITLKKYCYFVVWTPYGLHYEKIDKDDSFWKDDMKEKLISFYDKHLLPELKTPNVVSIYNRNIIGK